MSWEDKYKALVAEVTEKIPGFEIRFKNESFTQKLIGALMFFNRRYMTSFTTTIYPKVFFPSRVFVEGDYGRAFRILAHEYVHLWDAQHTGPRRFSWSYLFPQNIGLLSVFAVLSFVSLWFLFGLLFLLLLLPWPAPWRAQWEYRGYSMNLCLQYWGTGAVNEETVNVIAGHFFGMNYYKMVWSHASVTHHITKIVDNIKQGLILEGPGGEPFYTVYRIMKGPMK